MSSLGIRDCRDEFCCFRSIRSSGIRLVWEITGRCNLACRHCFANDIQSHELDSETCLRVIRDFPLINVKKVMFTGGEPLLRNDIVDLIKASKNSGAEVDVVTNGLLLSEERIKDLLASGLTEMTISLDGPESIHDLVRGRKGAFQKVTASMRRLVNTGCAVDVVCVVTRENVHALQELVEVVIKLKCSSLTLSGLSGRSLPLSTFQKLALDPRTLDELKNKVTKWRGRVQDRLPIRTVALFSRPTSNTRCGVKRMVAIDKQGYVKHCLLAGHASERKQDVQLGLAKAWRSIDRSMHCGLYRWAIHDS